MITDSAVLFILPVNLVHTQLLLLTVPFDTLALLQTPFSEWHGALKLSENYLIVRVKTLLISVDLGRVTSLRTYFLPLHQFKGSSM